MDWQNKLWQQSLSHSNLYRESFCFARNPRLKINTLVYLVHMLVVWIRNRISCAVQGLFGHSHDGRRLNSSLAESQSQSFKGDNTRLNAREDTRHGAEGDLVREQEISYVVADNQNKLRCS